MSQQAKNNKTLRQYRRDQEDLKHDNRGADLEDMLLMEPVHQAQSEQSLWRAIILQMMTDALSNSQKSDHQRFKRDAWHWLTSHSRDFRMVCDYAGYDPKWLQEQVNRFLANHQNPFTKRAARQESLSAFSRRCELDRSRYSEVALALKTSDINMQSGHEA